MYDVKLQIKFVYTNFNIRNEDTLSMETYVFGPCSAVFSGPSVGRWFFCPALLVSVLE